MEFQETREKKILFQIGFWFRKYNICCNYIVFFPSKSLKCTFILLCVNQKWAVKGSFQSQYNQSYSQKPLLVACIRQWSQKFIQVTSDFSCRNIYSSNLYVDQKWEVKGVFFFPKLYNLRCFWKILTSALGNDHQNLNISLVNYVSPSREHFYFRVFRINGSLVYTLQMQLCCASWHLTFSIFAQSRTSLDNEMQDNQNFGCSMCPHSEVIFNLWCSQLWNGPADVGFYTTVFQNCIF